MIIKIHARYTPSFSIELPNLLVDFRSDLSVLNATIHPDGCPIAASNANLLEFLNEIFVVGFNAKAFRPSNDGTSDNVIQIRQTLVDGGILIYNRIFYLLNVAIYFFNQISHGLLDICSNRSL